MKRLIALIIVLNLTISLVFTFASCGSKDDSGQELTVSTGFCSFGNYYFYSARKTKDTGRKTVKYAFFPQLEDRGIPIYNDFFGENEDPFEGLDRCLILADRDATEKNGGLPVLIIAYQIPENAIGETNYDYRLVSFNTGNNSLTVIDENIGSAIFEIALYGDTIYYSRFEGDVEGIGSMQSADADFGVYAISKNGGKTKKLQFPDNSFFSFRCAYNGKIYLESTVLEKAFRCEPDLTDPEPLPAYSSDCQPWKYSGGWLYYKTNFRKTEIDGVEAEYFDLCRKPLDKIENARGELVLENVQKLYDLNDNEVYYTGLSDVMIVNDYSGRPCISNNLVKWKKLSSEAQGVVFDNRNDPVVHSCWLITEKYYMISKWDISNLNIEVYDRESGEKRIITDLLWG